MKDLAPKRFAALFPDAPRRNIRANLPIVTEALEAHGLLDLEMVCVALATIRAETPRFEPTTECKGRWNTDAEPFDRYDSREDLGNQGSPDGERFRGRGFVQLTGRANYRRLSRLLQLDGRLDLEDNPHLANVPRIAAAILVRLLKVQEGPIRQALKDENLALARRLVNRSRYGLHAFTRTYEAARQLLSRPPIARAGEWNLDDGTLEDLARMADSCRAHVQDFAEFFELLDKSSPLHARRLAVAAARRFPEPPTVVETPQLRILVDYFVDDDATVCDLADFIGHLETADPSLAKSLAVAADRHYSG